MCLDVSGCVWMCLDVPGCVWMRLDVLGCAWMSEESIGGRENWGNELEGLEAEGKSIMQIAADVNKMMKPLRLFRTLAQWMVALLRYTVAAIGAGQWSWTCFSSHVDLVNRMAEREGAKYGAVAPFVAMSYEERRRKQWAERVRRKDKSLDSLEKLCEECHVEDLVLLEEARTRVYGIVERAGISLGFQGANFHPARSNPANAGSGFDPSQAMESVMAKQNAAVEATMKRSQDTARLMARQQEDFLHKTNAMMASGGKGSNGTGIFIPEEMVDQYGSRRQAKKALWGQTIGKGDGNGDGKRFKGNGKGDNFRGNWNNGGKQAKSKGRGRGSGS